MLIEMKKNELISIRLAKVTTDKIESFIAMFVMQEQIKIVQFRKILQSTFEAWKNCCEF